MKALLSFIIILLASNSSFGQFSMDRYHPKDIIVSKRIDTCFIYDLNDDGSMSIRQSISYDKSGNELSNIRDYQGYKYEYGYNEEGLKVTESLVPFDEPPYETDTFIYDENNHLKERNTYRNGEISKQNKYEYKDGKLYVDTYIYNGEVRVKTYYTYNEFGNIDTTKRVVRGVDDGYYKYTYDDDQNLIQFNSYHANGSSWITHKYVVNEKGLRTEFHVHDSGGALTQFYTTEYDEDGLIIWTERYTKIINSKIDTADYSKQVYKYSTY